MISGHVHLLSILSWGILVYQTSMSFLLHFILQHGKKLVNQEEQVNQILELLNGDNISEQLKNSAILGRLGEILET